MSTICLSHKHFEYVERIFVSISPKSRFERKGDNNDMRNHSLVLTPPFHVHTNHEGICLVVSILYRS